MISFIVITTIVLKRNPKEKLNWIFASSFFFLAAAYAVLPTGAFVYNETNPTPMLNMTKVYAFFLFIALVLLLLSAIAINYSTYFILLWFILLPTIILITALGITIFATDLITAVPGPNPDTKTEALFLYLYYPLSLMIAVCIYVFYIRAYKQTSDENLRLCLKYFLAGFSICIFSIVPNLLSNILADILEQAQVFNGLEFIMVLIGTAVLLRGFLIKSKKKATAKGLSIESPESQLQPR